MTFPDKFISKGDHFDAGTEAHLVHGTGCFWRVGDDWNDPASWAGIFEGIRDGKPDEEVCRFDEFEGIGGRSENHI